LKAGSKKEEEAKEMKIQWAVQREISCDCVKMIDNNGEV